MMVLHAVVVMKVEVVVVAVYLEKPVSAKARTGTHGQSENPEPHNWSLRLLL